MFSIYSLEELQRIRKLLGAFDNSTVQFPIEVYRTKDRISGYQCGSNSEDYTYTVDQKTFYGSSDTNILNSINALGPIEQRIAREKEALEYERTVADTIRSETCHDCRAEEGAVHDFGCDMERCPFCGHQLISCGCIYDHLGYEQDSSDPYYGLGNEVFENGPSSEEEERFLNILEAKGRIPYIIYPVICGKCGKLWPEFFKVSPEEWERYIEPEMRREVICWECYVKIRAAVDSHITQVA